MATRSALTLEGFLAMPETKPASEYACGEVLQKPMPDIPHSVIQFYLLNGVRLVWVIDPATSSVVVQAPGQEARVLRSGDVLDGGEVLPGFSVPADEIFAQMQMDA